MLLYYTVTNIAAFTQQPEHRRFPRPLQALGVIGCLTLVVTLPITSVLVSLTVLEVGIIYRRFGTPRA